MTVEQPPSFNEEHDWGLWVLQNGLPRLPSSLGVGDVVPVARWVGPRFAAVLTVYLRVPDEDDEEDEQYPDFDIDLFRRVSDGWEAAFGNGGSSWYDPPFERPPMESREAWFGGEFAVGGEGWYACGMEGFAGPAAATVEVEDDDGTASMPIESPFGAFVVAVDATRPALIRVRDDAGAVLGETRFSGYDWARS